MFSNIKKVACFAYHKEIPVYPLGYTIKKLQERIESLISMGVVEFISGGNIGFDTIAALAVIILKEKYPEIKLTFILPHYQFLNTENPNYLLNIIINEADIVIYTAEEYYDNCEEERNIEIVDRCYYCLCCIGEEVGEINEMIVYAKNSGLKIFNIS